MKIATVTHGARTAAAIVDVEQNTAVLLSPDVTALDLLAADPPGRNDLVTTHADEAIALDEVTLRSPVHPGALRDFVSFEKHVEGMERPKGHDRAPDPWFEHPTLIFMNPHSAIATGDPVEPPPDAQVMDFELEVAAVIGRPCRNVSVEQAAEHIAGYTICNDWSARDIQGRDMRMGLGPSKGKDFATTIGPWVVTPDELEPFRTSDGRLDLAMTVSINGVEFGADRLSHMAWTFEEIVAYSARAAWVGAGDVLMSGTCSGGALAERWGRTGTQDPPPLTTGDVVTMTVEGIGTIENELVAPAPEAAPIPPATRLFD